MPAKTYKKSEPNFDDVMNGLFKKYAEDYEQLLLIKKKGAVPVNGEEFDEAWKKRIEVEINKYMENMGVDFQLQECSSKMRKLADDIDEKTRNNPSQDPKLRQLEAATAVHAREFAEKIDNMYSKIDEAMKGAQNDVKAKHEGKGNKKTDYIKPLKYALAGVLIAAAGVVIGAAIVTGGYVAALGGLALPGLWPLMSAAMMVGGSKGFFAGGAAIGGMVSAATFGVFSIAKNLKDYFFKDQAELEKKLRNHANDLKSAADEIIKDRQELANKYGIDKTKIERQAKGGSYVKDLINRDDKEKPAKDTGSSVRK
ncbi:MAG: hypothetical protein K0Q51_1274 [Rickettsiaceae bacterium]|jgi:hypothetical protein|nr:hypothetical protein [Rickettsiaceae bacterium]